MFNKEFFMKRNGEFLYNKLLDFLDVEVNDITTNFILQLIDCKNIRSFEYEGNQYVIVKSSHCEDLLVFDEISEEHGVLPHQSRFYIKSIELLELIQKKRGSKSTQTKN